MAHVLIPTDHSAHALNAAVYALRLFGQSSDRFTVLNTLLIPPDPLGSALDMHMEVLHAARENNEAFVERVRQAVPGNQADLRNVCMQGELAGVIADLAAEDGPPVLVVMGTQGASGLDEVLFGSNTANVVKHSGLPVLAVPAQARYSSPKRILLADDGGPTDKQSLRPLIDIVRRSHGEISVVRVMDESSTTDVSSDTYLYDELLGAIPHSQQYLHGENVEAALNELADQGDAGMLAVLHRQRGVFNGLFHRSVSARLAMHVHLPLLVLQQRPL